MQRFPPTPPPTLGSSKPAWTLLIQPAIDCPQQHRLSAQVTDLLYSKQTQLEEMAATRAVQQMAFERELATARSEAERSARHVTLFLSPV